MLSHRNATTSVCHSHTTDLPQTLAMADIVVAAIGRPRFVKGEWLKPGSTVIDVGINRTEDGRLCGDVDFEGAMGRVGAITPVPGGIGPLTVAMLASNLWKAFLHSTS